MNAASSGVSPSAALKFSMSRRIDSLVGELDGPHAVGEQNVRHRVGREQPHRQVGERSHVVALELGLPLEAAVALPDVGAEAGLAHLPVADDIDADLALLGHHLLDGDLDARIELGSIDLLAVHAGPHQLHQLRRPRQAARVRGHDPIRHRPHLQVVSARVIGAEPAGSSRP
jgi:hypothetical protein